MIIVDFQNCDMYAGDRAVLNFSIDDGNSASGSDIFTIEDGLVVRISFETLGAMLGVNLEDYTGAAFRIEEDTGYVWDGDTPASGNIEAMLA